MHILQRTGQNAFKRLRPEKSDYEFEDRYNDGLAGWKKNEEAIERKIRECNKHNAVEHFTLHYQSRRIDGTYFGALICKNCGEIFRVILDPLELNQLRFSYKR